MFTAGCGSLAAVHRASKVNCRWFPLALADSEESGDSGGSGVGGGVVRVDRSARSRTERRARSNHTWEKCLIRAAYCCHTATGHGPSGRRGAKNRGAARAIVFCSSLGFQRMMMIGLLRRGYHRPAPGILRYQGDGLVASCRILRLEL